MFDYDNLREEYSKLSDEGSVFPEEDIVKFIDLILNSNQIDYFEYYDGITITNESGVYLTLADGNELVFYINLLFNLLHQSKMKELSYRSRFASEISFENFKGIPKTMKKLSADNFLKLDIIKFKDELEKIEIIDLWSNEMVDDMKNDWKNGELGEINVYDVGDDLYYIMESKFHKVKEGDTHDGYNDVFLKEI